jgi:uncharacterized membrane protein YhiD involved in acid resistance
MDVSTVYEMFEKINEKLGKSVNSTIEPIQMDMTAIDTMAERLENIIEEVKKPAKVEYQHRHTIDIRSNWFFLSWVALVIIILGLSWTIANQQQTINQHRDNDLKYRCVKMQGQTNEENLYRLEHQFKYNDSIKIIRNQVEKYEELVKEQIERMERAKQDSKELENLKRNLKMLKSRNIK